MADDTPDFPPADFAATAVTDVPAAGAYKISDGRKKRGRPRKMTSHPETPAATRQSKRRGRPPKRSSKATPTEKKRRGRPPKSTPLADPSSVYIIPQAKKLKTDVFQNYPGAAAIILPRSLLAEKAGKSSIVISPKVIQSLIDASTGKRKRGRPRSVHIKEKPAKSSKVAKRKPGRPRKNAVVLNKKLVAAGKGKYSSKAPVGKGPGRPWKIRDLVVSGNEHAVVANGDKNESIKKRPVGRPRKKPLIEGFNPPAV